LKQKSEHLSFAGEGVTLAAERWLAEAGQDSKGIVLLLHGGGQTRHSWQNTGQRLAAEGWSAITIDARGHGDSDWARDGDYSFQTMAKDLRRVIEALGERPVLVGASMGGLVSLLALGNDTSLARALVLVDITPRIERKGSAEIVAFMRSGLHGFASLQEAGEAISAFNPLRRREPSEGGLHNNLRFRHGRWYWHWDPKFFAQIELDAQDAFESEAYAAARRLSLPTLLVRGTQSRIVSEEQARELLEAIPTAQYVDVEAGHMVAGDDNDAFGDRLLEFLNGSAIAET
jgi:pimeloyl-ACP methyl ester carboxylesterase